MSGIVSHVARIQGSRNQGIEKETIPLIITCSCLLEKCFLPVSVTLNSDGLDMAASQAVSTPIKSHNTHSIELDAESFP